MCLLILAHRFHEEFPLVVAANRDEFHARRTAPSRFWRRHPDLLAGQDLVQGGTWMGVTRDGRFAAVTNYRDPSRTHPAPRSRGQLPLEFLAGSDGPEAYLQALAATAGDYAGFNLLVGDREDLWYFSNSAPSGAGAPQRLDAGIYGLSNASLDTPWPKVLAGKTSLGEVLQGELTHDGLTRVVSRRDLADVESLRIQGLEGEMEQTLSAQFIVSETYGTRSTTTLWRDAAGIVRWREFSYDARGNPVGVHTEVFSLG